MVTSGLVTASELLQLMDGGLEEWHTGFGRRRAPQPSEAAKRRQQAGHQQKQQSSLSTGASAPAQQQRPGGKPPANSSAIAQRSSAAAADEAEAHEPAPVTAAPRLTCMLWPGLVHFCPEIPTAPLQLSQGRHDQ